VSQTGIQYSTRYRFAEWPNSDVPKVAIGVYAIWEGESLIYCGMSGRALDTTAKAHTTARGLYTRLASHASGRLSGDQFCVYVANRLVLPGLTLDLLAKFATRELTLDQLTRDYIVERLTYQFACLATAQAAFAHERECRQGLHFGVAPLLNPLVPRQ
jgi:hypothetical protein